MSRILNLSSVRGLLTSGSPARWAVLFAGLLLLWAGLFFVCSDLFGIPSSKSSLALRRASRPKGGRPSLLDVWLGGLSSKLSRLIGKFLSDSMRGKLQTDLSAVGDARTPEAYLADGVTRAVPIAAAAIPCLFVFPVLSPFVLIAAAVYGVSRCRSAGKAAERKREAIESDMPAFVSGISASLKHGRNVLSVLDACRIRAGEELRRELDVTAADMRTGNDETALSRLEIRAGSPLLTEAVRGLRAVLRGDDTEAYWVLLRAKCADERKQKLRKEAMKVPRKVKKLSLALLLCFLLTYLTVIGTQLAGSLGVLFG